MSSSAGSRNRRFVEEVLPHAAAAYNLARWLSRSDANARDIVQETFVRALRYFDSYHGGSARAWLLTIVRNTAYSWLSANPPTAYPQLAAVSATGEAPSDADPDPNADPLVGLARQQEADHLRQAIAQLPAEYREVLILRELEDLSYQQIATIVGCPIGTVMSRLSRARNELGNRLRREASGP
jgi:RNA polymerase sigma factor (sigma-70 family)